VVWGCLVRKDQYRHTGTDAPPQSVVCRKVTISSRQVAKNGKEKWLAWLWRAPKNQVPFLCQSINVHAPPPPQHTATHPCIHAYTHARTHHHVMSCTTHRHAPGTHRHESAKLTLSNPFLSSHTHTHTHTQPARRTSTRSASQAASQPGSQPGTADMAAGDGWVHVCCFACVRVGAGARSHSGTQTWAVSSLVSQAFPFCCDSSIRTDDSRHIAMVPCRGCECVCRLVHELQIGSP